MLYLCVMESIKIKLDLAIKEQRLAYDTMPLGKDWKEFEGYMKPYSDKVDDLSRQYRMVKIPTYKDCPKYGDEMSLKNFIENCEDGGFIDYDGSGNYMKNGKMSDISIYPSDVKFGLIRKDFDTMIWFNR